MAFDSLCRFCSVYCFFFYFFAFFSSPRYAHSQGRLLGSPPTMALFDWIMVRIGPISSQLFKVASSPLAWSLSEFTLSLKSPDLYRFVHSTKSTEPGCPLFHSSIEHSKYWKPVRFEHGPLARGCSNLHEVSVIPLRHKVRRLME